MRKKLQNWYYYQELKELSLVAAVIAATYFLYNYGKMICTWLISPEGMTWSAFLMATIVMMIVIKIYYRIMVIKYHEKDTRIELFKELKTNT